MAPIFSNKSFNTKLNGQGPAQVEKSPSGQDGGYKPSGIKIQIDKKYKGNVIAGTVPSIGKGTATKTFGWAVDKALNGMKSAKLLSHHIKIGRQMANSLAKQMKARNL